MERDELVAVALGERPAGLVIRGGRLVNVYSGEIYAADVAVMGERIAAVGDVDRCVGPDTAVVDASGRYLVPGFIETHFHVGATSLGSTELAKLLVPYGTAAIVTDFTEATKLKGAKAARFFLDEANRTPLKVYFSPFYTAMLGTAERPGVSPEEFEEMLAWPECLELREWNVQSQRHASPLVRAAGESALRRGKLLAGHMRAQLGAVLQASVSAGTRSDHEAYTLEEAVERIRAGVAVQIRFGSAHWTETWDLLRVVTERRLDPSLVMFSTDEQEVVDIRDLGFMDHRVRLAIEAGVAPVEAVRMASLNPARYLGVTGDLGGVAPGRLAFVSLVDDLRSFEVTAVVHGEQVVARDRRYLGELERPEYPADYYGTVKLRAPLTAEDFRVPVAAGRTTATVRTIGFDQAASGTREVFVDVPVVSGGAAADPANDVVKLASFERLARSGKRGVGFVRGLGMRRGALGFTYHPGSCDLAIIGSDDADMALVGNRIAELGGGLVVAIDGEVVAEVPMGLLGIVSDRPVDEVEAGMRRAKEIIAGDLGIDFPGNVYRLAVLFIPGVAPELRMAIDGLLRIAYAGDRLDVNVVPVVVDAPDAGASATAAEKGR
ncbi:MAG: adenine deaminase [Trueperaceae bacterium]|nr:adenine deaminase [Trueperaceae bacterium]MCC6309745.1 adenine deaminase [Trueperaceae bacterium]MCO5173905.1 amidohydrolase family protein [Trueperaceae bacterium]MCW5820653.1 adenine deaminase [Trueperaceae bacterium]